MFPFKFQSTNFPTFQIDLATQADNKALVAVYMRDRRPAGHLYRFTAAGALDTEFGTSGDADITQFPPRAIALQKDGRIIIAGVHNQTRAFVARLWD